MNHLSEYASLVAKLNEDMAEYAEERAGIREFDGGLTRDLAECLALLDILMRDPLAFAGVSLRRVRRDRQVQFVLTTEPYPGGEAADLYAVIASMGGKAELAPAK